MIRSICAINNMLFVLFIYAVCCIFIFFMYTMCLDTYRCISIWKTKRMDIQLKRMKKRMPWTLLVFAILIVNALYWCIQKEGYYIDELWSYGLSNSYYSPFLYQEEDYMNTWHQPIFYENYLMVKQGESFSYGSVYNNQIYDVHPPFYYILLHTVCSFFPNRFSKWFGLSINLLFFCASVFLLYKISGLLLGEMNYVRLLPPLLYGLSMGAVSTLIYIRMYMLLTFWTLLFVCLLFLLMKTSANPKKILLLTGIGLTTMAGFLTQYYFILFAFFFSAGYIFRNLLTHQWRKTVEYLSAVFAGIVLGILIFPASLHHIFYGQQGRRAFSNAFNHIHLFLKRWIQYQDVMINEFFGIGHRKQTILLLAFLILITAAIYSAKKKKQSLRIRNSIPKTECLILLNAVICYFALIVQISPEVVDRYQFIIYPFCVLLVIAVTSHLFKQLERERLIWITAAACLFLMLQTYTTQPIPYVYKGYQNVIDTLGTEYKNVPGIYVTAGDHLLINNCLFLAQQDMTYPLTLEQSDNISEICGEIDTEQLILYVDIYYNEFQTAKEIAGLLGYQSYALLYDNTFTQIFLLSR